MDTGRMSPAERATEQYYDAAADALQRELLSISNHIHQAYTEMDAEVFKRYLNSIGMDETTARDFLESDGTVESMTSRMWVYFESPLKPHAARFA